MFYATITSHVLNIHNTQEQKSPAYYHTIAFAAWE